MKRLSIVVLISLSIMCTGINAFAAEMMYMIDFTVAWGGDTQDSQVNEYDWLRLTLYGDTDNILEIPGEPGVVQYELVCTSGKLEKIGFFSWELEGDWKVMHWSDSNLPFSGIDAFSLRQLGEGGEGDGTGFEAVFYSTQEFTLSDSFIAELFSWPLTAGSIRTTGEDVNLTDAWPNYYSQQLANPPTEDSDGDGIYDNVDEHPLAYSTRFSDTPLGGVTSGSILYMETGITVEIMDASDPINGVKAVVSGPADGIAEISIDGSTGIYNLSPGEYNLTTGSVFLQCRTGKAKVEFTIEGKIVVVFVEGTAIFQEIIINDELKELIVQAVEGIVEVDGEVLPPEQSLSVMSVSIDIKPGSDPNCFNSNSHGVIPVAILSSVEFDAATVDPFTVSLDGANVRVKGKSGNAGSLEDVNSDGLLDLVVQIMDDGVYETGDTIATLTAETFDGISIIGTDTLCIVP